MDARSVSSFRLVPQRALVILAGSPQQPVTKSDRRISPNMSLDQTIAAPSPSASANGPPVSPELFWEAAWGFQKTAAIKAAIELDVFTKIGAGAHGLAMLAEQTGAARRGLRILCDYLTISGFLEKLGEDYNLTPSSQAFLNRRSPSYFGGVLDFIASPQMIGRFLTTPPRSSVTGAQLSSPMSRQTILCG